MKFPKWPLLLGLLAINQLLRSPFHLWNWSSTIGLQSTEYKSVVYEANNSTVEVFERTGASEDSSVLLIFPDMHSPIGAWRPFLEQIEFDGTVRFVRWFGRGDSVWKGSTIVFSDLDSILNIVLSDVDDDASIQLVGQGVGAQLAIRYLIDNPTRNIHLFSIYSEGFSSPRLVPQMIAELETFGKDIVQEQWLPKFVYRDWLTWLNNPFSLAIEKETHLVPSFKNSDFDTRLSGQITWVGSNPLSDAESAPLQDCSFEAQWTCTADLLSILRKGGIQQ